MKYVCIQGAVPAMYEEHVCTQPKGPHAGSRVSYCDADDTMHMYWLPRHAAVGSAAGVVCC